MSPARIETRERECLRLHEVRSRGFLRIWCWRSELQFFCGQSRQDSRQLHAESGAAFLPVVAENPAAVFLHDAEANTETQPRAFADRLGGVERIEHAVRLLDAGPGIQKK